MPPSADSGPALRAPLAEGSVLPADASPCLTPSLGAVWTVPLRFWVEQRTLLCVHVALCSGGTVSRVLCYGYFHVPRYPDIWSDVIPKVAAEGFLG